MVEANAASSVASSGAGVEVLQEKPAVRRIDRLENLCECTENLLCPAKIDHEDKPSHLDVSNFLDVEKPRGIAESKDFVDPEDGTNSLVKLEASSQMDHGKIIILPGTEGMPVSEELPPPKGRDGRHDDVLDLVFEKVESLVCPETSYIGTDNQKILDNLDFCRERSLLCVSSSATSEVKKEKNDPVPLDFDSKVLESFGESQDNNQKQNPFYKTRKCLIAMILLLIVIIALIVVGIVLMKSGTYQNSQSAAVPPSECCSQKPKPILNDKCSKGFFIAPNNSASAVGNTTEAAAVTGVPSCGSAIMNGPGLYYRLIGDGRLFSASTCDNQTNFDTQISVFRGSCDGLLCIDGNDNFCNDQSQVSWFAEAGTEYFLIVSGFREKTGTFRLTVKANEVENFACDAAISISAAGGQLFGTTKPLLSSQASNLTCTGLTIPGLWYKLLGTGRTMQLSTCSNRTDYLSYLSLFAGDSCSNLTCTENFAVESCNDAQGETITFLSQPNMLYYILVHGSLDAPAHGDFELSVQAPGYANENCDQSIELYPDGSLEVGFIGGTMTNNDTVFQGTCGSSTLAGGPLAWYTVAGYGGNMTATTCDPATTFDTQLTILSGNCSSLTCVEGNDQSSCSNLAQVTWQTNAGEIYYLVVHGKSGSEGVFGLRLFKGGP